MEKLKVIKKENNKFTLISEENHKLYNFELTFFDIDEQLEVGDFLIFHKELLDPNYIEYASHYYFGGLDQPYGRKIETDEHTDVIGLIVKNKRIKLKRFFG